ncbi:hypothetical protein GHK86_02445 [Acidimicrobiaceae bacterium USS-CC1]|uniref:Nucleotidyltransferase domain-containing protein n=1 Tax=Acidiferrimicrobium australe TaxID=2664430 RepID=A0ABW9QPL4_9ACTN|nr:hypothetical protein [Acidiferrimicrobium australe]
MSEPTGRTWVEALPKQLAPQRRLLEVLLAFCEQDPAVAWLVIGCSLARGNADALSDLDLALGVDDADADDESIAERVRRALLLLGEPVDSLTHSLPGGPQRIFVQYVDRSQIDLVLGSATAAFPADTVVLYDPHAAVTITGPAPGVAPSTLREWAFLACAALADVGKYLRRRSAWEAHARLGTARDELWKLFAVALGARDPQFGLTSIVDFAPELLPAAMQATVTEVDLDALTAAARAAAALLAQIADQLPPTLAAGFPAEMLAYVTAELGALTPTPGPGTT